MDGETSGLKGPRPIIRITGGQEVTWSWTEKESGGVGIRGEVGSFMTGDSSKVLGTC